MSRGDYLIASDELVRLQCEHVHLLFGSWFRTPPPPLKRTKGRGNVSEKTSFQVKAGPVKGQKQNRDEKIQDDYATLE